MTTILPVISSEMFDLDKQTGFPLPDDRLTQEIILHKSALVSYWYIWHKVGAGKKQRNLNWLTHLHTHGVKVILDSGAFTEENSHKEIKTEEYLKEYAAFLRQHKALFETYITLDKITSNGKESLDRNEYLLKQGLSPMPVFHFNPVKSVEEEKDYLQYCIDHPDKNGVVGLGGTVGERNPRTLDGWYFEIFNRYPNQRFHALGVGNPELLIPYPFYYADSKTWTIDDAKNGNIRFWVEGEEKTTTKYTAELPDSNRYRYMPIIRQQVAELTKDYGLSVQDLIEEEYR